MVGLKSVHYVSEVSFSKFVQVFFYYDWSPSFSLANWLFLFPTHSSKQEKNVWNEKRKNNSSQLNKPKDVFYCEEEKVAQNGTLNYSFL